MMPIICACDRCHIAQSGAGAFSSPATHRQAFLDAEAGAHWKVMPITDSAMARA